MLDHGKHILCEKPLCLNEKQARQLLEYAKSKKLFCMEAIWSRCFPAYEYVLNRIQVNLKSTWALLFTFCPYQLINYYLFIKFKSCSNILPHYDSYLIVLTVSYH